MAALALTLGIPSGLGCWFGFFEKRRSAGAWAALVQMVLLDALLAIFILCVLSLVWAVAAPRWLERWLERRALAAWLAVLLAGSVVVIWLWRS